VTTVVFVLAGQKDIEYLKNCWQNIIICDK
jgi:hypothetical protein